MRCLFQTEKRMVSQKKKKKKRKIYKQTCVNVPPSICTDNVTCNYVFFGHTDYETREVCVEGSSSGTPVASEPNADVYRGG